MTEPPSPLLFARTPSRLRRTPLRRHAQRLMDEVTSGRGFTCLLTDDAQIRELNRTWRKKDEPTDVLSFPAAPLPPELACALGSGGLGELAISCERARLQAKENGHTLEEEIAILMLHGVLHLMGLDHETDNGRMRRVETRWRRRLGLPAGLIERSSRVRAR